MMGPLWSETCWSTFKYFIILIVSAYCILCVGWVVKCLLTHTHTHSHTHSLTHTLTRTLTHSLTPYNTALLQKLTGLQPVKKFPAFHGTRRFITALTIAHHLSLFWSSSIQSIYTHPTSCRSILILSTHLRLGLPSGLFPPGFPPKNPVYTSSLPHTRYMPSPSHSSPFYLPNSIVWAVQIIKLLIM
jgi:hypothetical protein